MWVRRCVDESVEGEDDEEGVVRRVNPGMGAEAQSESRPKLVIRQQQEMTESDENSTVAG